MATVIQYSQDLVIRNLDALPRGSGAPYLEVVAGPDDELVAKAWRRKVPQGEVVVVAFKEET